MSSVAQPVLASEEAPDQALEKWLESKLNWIVAAILALGLGLRLYQASGTFLNPDEALHHILVNRNSLWEAYKASLTNAHPPLYFVLLYYWRFIGSSEFMLRLPSVLASTGAAWIAYRWVSLVFGKAAGLSALVLLSLSPMLIVLGAEVRNYSLLLLMMSGALYFLERGFTDRKVLSIVYSGLFLCGAILSHYSALWFVIPLGVYGLLRIADLVPRARIAWVVSQLCGAGIYATLYITHISKMRKSGMEAAAIEGWLSAMYYRPTESHVAFLRRNITDVFQFMFSSPAGGNIAQVMFFAGVLWLLFSIASKKRQEFAAVGLLLLMPFGLAAAASLADVYPLGGTRHCVYLILFAAAGVSFLFSKVSGNRLFPALVLAIAYVWYSNAHRFKDPQHIDRKDQSIEWMTAAIEDLRSSVPPPGPIVSDYQASTLLEYYLSRDQVPPAPRRCAGSFEAQYGPYRVIVVGDWSVTAEMLKKALEDWHHGCDSQSRDAEWVFDGGWWPNLLEVFKYSGPRSVSRGHWYGGSVSFFKLRLAEPPRSEVR